MLNSVKSVAKAPWLARCTWVVIMLLATVFAMHCGVAATQIKALLWVSAAYIVVVGFGYYFYHKHTKLLFVSLLGDLLAWSAFIYFSGGASNPLITLLLTVIAVSAIVLTTRYIIALSLLSVVIYGLLWYFHVPLIMHHEHLVAEKLHLLGMFGVFVFALVMLTALTVYFKHTINQSYQALEKAQQAIYQQRRMLAVSSLAANIAHEMSTPLASMQLLTDEIAGELDADDELLDDILLLQSQIQVCRRSLDALKQQIHNQNLGHQQEAAASQLDELFPKLIGDWCFLNPHVQVVFKPLNKPLCVAINPEQLYAILINILNNAMQAAADCITVTIEQHDSVVIDIKDNGVGIDTAILNKISSKQPTASNHGWGMGLVLADTILTAVGGKINLRPIVTNGSIMGTQVILTLNPCQQPV